MDDPEFNGVDYYAVLNVPKDSSQDDVAKAYRKLAQVFHPDKHQDQELQESAKDAFRKLQEAYEVLSDVQKRQIYDIYGKQVLTWALWGVHGAVTGYP
jgi:DnaJ-class molecular chaperone